MTRRKHYRFGLWAECLCRLSLRLRGYRILAARCRTPQGEIDIVAATAHVVAVIEVKARRDAASVAEALGARQQERLTRAAQTVLARWPECRNVPLRFDLMLVTPWRWPQHMENAWQE